MQSVIVYRNPLEAAIWESLMGGGGVVFFAVLLIGLVGVLTYVGIEKMHARAYRRWRATGRPYRCIATLYLHVGKISIGVSLLTAAVMHYWYVYG